MNKPKQPAFLDPEPAIAVIRSLRSQLALWRLVAIGALFFHFLEAAVLHPRATLGFLLALACVVTVVGDVLFLWYGEDKAMGFDGRDQGLTSIHPQPPIL